MDAYFENCISSGLLVTAVAKAELDLNEQARDGARLKIVVDKSHDHQYGERTEVDGLVCSASDGGAGNVASST